MIGRRFLFTLESHYAHFQGFRKISYNYTGDHSHGLSFSGRHAAAAQIEKLLSAGAIEIDFTKYISTGALNQNCPIKRVYVNQLAANSPLEDRWNIGLTQVDGIVSSCLFTVLDGHSGTMCAHTLAWSMLDYVAAAFLEVDKLHIALEYWKTHDADQPYHLARRLDLTASKDGRLLGHAAQPPPTQLSAYMRSCLREYVEYLVRQSDRNMDPEYCLKDALQRIDADLCSVKHSLNLKLDRSEQEALNSPEHVLSRDLLRVVLSGAVAVVGGLFWYNDTSGYHTPSLPQLHLANVGDCRAVLLRKQEGSDNLNSLQAIPCTVPHQGISNLDEIKRIISAHPENNPNELLRMGGRLLGELAPSRAFGDVRYKWSAKEVLQLSELLHRLNRSKPELTRSITGSSSLDFLPLPHPYTSPPYLTAQPEVTSFELTPDDRYLILASDGLWDMLSDSTATTVMEADLDRPTSPATRLLWTCLTQIPPQLANQVSLSTSQSANSNQARAVRAAHNRALKLLNLPAGLARYYRDDITVMVIEFST